MKVWILFFGTSEVALRMPSILFSLGAGYVLYLIGVKLKNNQLGLWAAALFLFNPLIMYYSQEARMYMMATFFIVLSFYFLMTNTFLLTISFLLSFYTFYGTAFFIAAVSVYLLFKKRYKYLLLILGAFAASLLFYFPLLSKQFINSQIMRDIVLNWSSVLGKATVKNLILIPIKFSFGRINFDNKFIYYGLAGIWTSFLLILAFLGSIKNKRILFFLVLPLAAGVIFSFFTPLLQYFRFLYLVPFFILLIALSVFQSAQKWYVLSGFIILSGIYLFIPSYHREDWKSLVNFIPKNATVFMIPSSADALRYYRKDINIKNIRTNEKYDSSILVIPYTVDIYGYNYKEDLEGKGYVRDGVISKRGVVIETWNLVMR